MVNTKLPLILYRWDQTHGQREPADLRQHGRRKIDTILPGWTNKEEEVAAKEYGHISYVRQQLR